MDLIDRQEAIDSVIKALADGKSWYYALSHLPSVERRGRQRGRWKGAGMGDYTCSLCSERVSGNKYRYCPNCGALMKGE